MAEVVRHEEPRVWKGALAGAVAGIAASWVMTRFQVLSKPVEGRDDAAMKAANETSKVVALGATAGAFYGMWRETHGAPGGAAFGAELWVVADQLGLPMVGLSPWPLQAYPASTNVQHFAAHLVYGVTTAVAYSVVRRAL